MNLLKRFALVAVLLVLAAAKLAAQDRELTNEVIATAGGSMSGAGMQMSWTIGEAIVTTLDSTPIILTQGFHQPLDYVAFNGVAGVRVLRAGEIAMYPNPAREYFNLALPTDLAGSSLEIIDESGTVVMQQNVRDVRSTIDCSSLAQGRYHVRLSTSESGELIVTLPLTILR